MKRLPLLLCILLIPALACSTTSLAEGLVSSGGVLYQEYFSDTKSGWGSLDNQTGKAGYVDDAYHIFVNQANTNLWSHPGKDFATIHEEVSVMPFSGPLENRMGLICRLKDDQNYYFLSISADGFYGIGKVQSGQTSLLTGSVMQPNNAILTGNQVNQLGADCIGNTLTLYVNNVLVATTKDDTFASGDVGILAGTFDQPGVDIYFDNFVVTKP